MYRTFGKRLLDLALTIPALILLAPLFALLALLVHLKLGLPILFCQQRPGLFGQPFTIYKFRTMTDARDTQGDLLPDAERLTPFGCFLRSISLDELPELFNVLKGEMSLIGPRPLLMRYYPYFTDAERVRFLMRPGITGWAQIHGRNTVPWDERLAYDVWYYENCTLFLDIKIGLMTIGKVLKREDISPDPSDLPGYDLDVERSML